MTRMNPLPPVAGDAANVVSEVSGIPLVQLLGRDRTAWVCEARFILYDTLYRSGVRMATIGEWLGRDHGAVSNGLKRLKKLSDTDARYRCLVAQCRDRFEIRNIPDYVI